MGKKYYVYKMINIENETLYIGKTSNIENRVKQHKRDKYWMDDAVRVYYSELKNKTDMDIYEIYYINKYNPIHNKDFMNENQFSIKLPELEFVEYKILAKKRKNTEKENIPRSASDERKHEIKMSIMYMKDEFEMKDMFKITYPCLYEITKDYNNAIYFMFADLWKFFEEVEDGFIMQKECTFLSIRDSTTIQLLRDLDFFKEHKTYYWFPETILYGEYFQQAEKNAEKILKNKGINPLEIIYMHSASHLFHPDTMEHAYPTYEHYKDCIKKFNN